MFTFGGETRGGGWQRIITRRKFVNVVRKGVRTHARSRTRAQKIVLTREHVKVCASIVVRRRCVTEEFYYAKVGVRAKKKRKKHGHSRDSHYCMRADRLTAINSRFISHGFTPRARRLEGGSPAII